MQVNVERAFNSVALEERMALVAKSQATGFSALLISFLLSIPIAYGYDNIYLLLFALGGSSMLYHAFASRAWRHEKPKLVLEYLAARTVGRRFGFMYHIKDLKVDFVLRGRARISANDPNKTAVILPGMSSKLREKPFDVWICVLGSGVTVFSEATGGAKLEFATPVTKDSTLTTEDDEMYGKVIRLGGVKFASGYELELSSPFPASSYLLEKKIAKIIKASKEQHELALSMVSSSGIK